MPQKSFYVFLTSLLGVLLFLILHRVVVFIYLYLVAAGFGAESFDYLTFLLWDYFSLTITLMLGAWYGIWLGLHWFEKVYVEKSHGGLVAHLARHVWVGGRPKNLQSKLSSVKQRLNEDLWQLEDLANAGLSAKQDRPEPRVRRVVRKQAPKKLK